MKKNKSKKMGIAILAGVLVGAGMLTWAMAISQKVKRSRPKPVATVVVEKKPHVYDAALLTKFESLLQTLDFNKKEFCYAGKFNVADGKDTTNNIVDLQFLFCRSGMDFYSRLGNTETINHNGLNVYVERDQKKVVVSNMDYQVKSAIGDLSQLVKTLNAEDYDLVSSVSGPVKKIALLNEHHISCKELAVTYDTLTNVLSGVLIRYTDFDHPESKSTERVLQMDLTKIDDRVRMKDYLAIKDIVKEENGTLALLPKFAGYELIKL